jgi:CrcB protein
LGLKKLAVVSIGGIVGSLSRWGISLLILDHGFPWATLLVNYLGSILFMLIVLFSERPTIKLGQTWWWRPALGAGFCGGFTTYSAFALKIDQYLTAHSIVGALIYSLASIVGSYLLLLATQKLFRRYFLDKDQQIRAQP